MGDFIIPIAICLGGICFIYFLMWAAENPVGLVLVILVIAAIAALAGWYNENNDKGGH